MRLPKIAFLTGVVAFILLIIFSQTSFAADAKEILEQMRKRATATMIVNDNPIKVEESTPRSSTRDFNIGTLLLNPNQTMVVADTTGSGVLHSVWFSTNSPGMLLTILIDGEEVWKDEVRVFCQNTLFNKQHIGYAGATGCGESTADASSIWGGYITPPLGFEFKESLRIEFKNTEGSQKILYSLKGQYSLD